MFNKRYDTLRHLSKIMLHYVTFLFHYQLWPCGSPKSTMVKYVQKDVFFYHVNTFTFEKRKKFIFVQKKCFDITTFINANVGLRHSSIVHSLMVLLHSDIQRQRSKHLFMDIEIHHSSMVVSHYSPSCCKNFLDIYI